MAEISDATSAKRLKTDIDPIFQSFWRDGVKRKQIERAISALENGSDDLSFGVLHLDVLNAHKKRSFADAFIEYSPLNLYLYADDKAYGFDAGVLFADGLDILKQYTDTEKPKIPSNIFERRALQNLLGFLSDEKDHEILLDEMTSEADQCVILAQHLLSRLTVDRNYTVTSYPGFTTGGTKCLCKQNDDLIGTIGDTSYGCENGWHGNADIILEGSDVQVAYVRQKEEEEDVTVSSVSDLNSKDYKRVIAQTIVFSFLQKKMHGNKLKNCLIPGVGISQKKIIVYFYDSENDILLSTKPLQLFRDDEIASSTLVFLWLTLNYRQFCSGIPGALKRYKAGFLDNPVLRQMYNGEVARPMHVCDTKADSMFPWSEKTVPLKSNKPTVEFVDLFQQQDDR
ncbi:uncharacterized protein LOC123535373 [Mercenaria mercenaria]|uniref:uncharacterized protein LOC123535373 n=1 Tax=Mercenaria mercenaria TaxID=6596 RepID=UPI00234FA93A|nr:uncharacterized protein LOC123535373 [Mercenaria mercenaria]